MADETHVALYWLDQDAISAESHSVITLSGYLSVNSFTDEETSELENLQAGQVFVAGGGASPQFAVVQVEVGEAEPLELSITDLEVSEAASIDSNFFSCIVLVDGAAAFSARDDGWGAGAQFDPIGSDGADLLAKANAWAEEQPPYLLNTAEGWVTVGSSLDLVVGSLVEEENAKTKPVVVEAENGPDKPTVERKPRGGSIIAEVLPAGGDQQGRVIVRDDGLITLKWSGGRVMNRTTALAWSRALEQAVRIASEAE